jgi:phage repressor protein C with HTH and peptisase S24 domain
MGVTPTYLNFLINDPALPHHKNLGEDLARRFEQRLNLEPGWFDRDQDIHENMKFRGVQAVSNQAPSGFLMVPRKHIAFSAGNGSMVFEEEDAPPLAFREDWLTKNKLKPDKLVVAYAVGDSMEPRIHDGDTLLIDLQQTAIRSENIFAIRVDDELRVKRIIKQTASVLVVSDNPTYPTETLTFEQAEQLQIIGRVVWVSGSL